MKSPIPKATLLLLLLSIAIYRLDSNAQWAIYDREKPVEIWRYLLASFAHYDLKHLTLNLMVFAILGIRLEQRTGSDYFCVSVLLTAISSTFILHCFFYEYSNYAGISTINYAMLGFLLISMFYRRRIELAVYALLILCYQALSVRFAIMEMHSLVQPVWQLHVLALIWGIVAGLYCLRNRSGNVVS
ncbi:rhomboid family intramembrane serine protease [Endozoicomonas lisbonensis]|uniref:Membrane associated rhomboid family serine protease n=1 Tax=Endozoicomonas lisbonensis TaxID=3120522 RepID=A0ABV2SHW0_9GAMM